MENLKAMGRAQHGRSIFLGCLRGKKGQGSVWGIAVLFVVVVMVVVFSLLPGFSKAQYTTTSTLLTFIVNHSQIHSSTNSTNINQPKYKVKDRKKRMHNNAMRSERSSSLNARDHNEEEQ